jgi:hypothetical protein
MDCFILKKLEQYYAKKQQEMLWALEMFMKPLANLKNPHNQNL